MTTSRITKRSADRLSASDKDLYLWDTELKGFGLKATPSGKRVYLVQYRAGGRNTPTRRVTIGAHGSLTPEQARREAGKLLAKVALGADPARERAKVRREGTIREVIDRYLEEHVVAHNKPSTVTEIGRIVAARILPQFGKRKVSEVTRAEVNAWHQSMHATPYEANRALAYFSKAMSLCHKEWELRQDNPCLGIKRFPEKKRERFLRDEELSQLGEALRKAEEAEAMPKNVLDAIRLLALTGCRLSEVLCLTWPEVDVEQGALRLNEAKTGARTVPLSGAAIELLRLRDREGVYVFSVIFQDRPMTRHAFHHYWRKVVQDAGLVDARPHDLRHTAGTFAAQAGLNAFLIRDFLGHKAISMTARYVGKAVDPLVATANAVGTRVAAALSKGFGVEASKVTPLPNRGATL